MEVNRYVQIASSSALALLVAACSDPSLINAYTILKQECDAGVTTEVDGIPVASTSFMLAKNQQIALGNDILGNVNRLTSKGKGDFSIQLINSNVSVTNLDDGRVIAESLSFVGGPDAVNDKLAITHSRSGNYTALDITMNCKDTKSIPPIGKSKSGFSPSNRSKPAPMAYRGFGRKLKQI